MKGIVIALFLFVIGSLILGYGYNELNKSAQTMGAIICIIGVFTPLIVGTLNDIKNGKDSN